MMKRNIFICIMVYYIKKKRGVTSIYLVIVGLYN